MSNILILAASEDINDAVGGMPDHQVRTMGRVDVEHLGRPNMINQLLEAGGVMPEIVMLGNELPLGGALSIAQILDSRFPTIELLLVAEPDTEVALRAMRVGVRELLSPSISNDELKVLLHRSAGNVSNRLAPHLVPGAQEAVEAGRVVVVASPKGGVGKSTIASNLAASLAAGGPMQTVLVDLDIQFGDSATLLDLNPTHSIADAFSTAAALDTLVLKTFLTLHPAGFYVLCGAESPTVSDNVSAEHVKRLLGQLSSQFRHVIVDTSAGLNEHTLAALEEANDVVLVTTMDVSSIRAMRKEMDVLAELGLLPSSRHVVLNMEDRHSGLVVRDVEGVLGVPVNVTIPRSSEVPVAGNRGETLLTTKKLGAAAKAIVALAGRLSVGDDPGQPEESGRKKKKAAKMGKRRGEKS